MQNWELSWRKNYLLLNQFIINVSINLSAKGMKMGGVAVSFQIVYLNLMLCWLI